MELAIRQFVDPFRHTRDPDVLLHHVVIGSNVFVTQRPVLSVSIVRRGLEIEIAQPITLASPDVGAASRDAHAPLPAEWHLLGGGVGLVQIVAVPLVVVFHAGVAVLLHGTRLLDDRGRLVAILQLECRFVLAEIRV